MMKMPFSEYVHESTGTAISTPNTQVQSVAEGLQVTEFVHLNNDVVNSISAEASVSSTCEDTHNSVTGHATDHSLTQRSTQPASEPQTLRSFLQALYKQQPTKDIEHDLRSHPVDTFATTSATVSTVTTSFLKDQQQFEEMNMASRKRKTANRDINSNMFPYSQRCDVDWIS